MANDHIKHSKFDAALDSHESCSILKNIIEKSPDGTFTVGLEDFPDIY
jgi:hypothetical protein